MPHVRDASKQGKRNSKGKDLPGLTASPRLNRPNQVSKAEEETGLDNSRLQLSDGHSRVMLEVREAREGRRILSLTVCSPRARRLSSVL